MSIAKSIEFVTYQHQLHYDLLKELFELCFGHDLDEKLWLWKSEAMDGGWNLCFSGEQINGVLWRNAKRIVL